MADRVPVTVGEAGVPIVGVASTVRRGSNVALAVGVPVVVGLGVLLAPIVRVGPGVRVAFVDGVAVAVAVGLGEGRSGRQRA